ncbi:hypothetical protein XELAEV_18025432mg [Xenopus laevis]|uniref:Uncharacterized protein n=1 Tax=Xenopus laevis TaxID=8355 RepID=A0A974D1Z2_XENLA|nr:hypothetical protein XELAEV_18025432mg [Xenopus laevis]
MGEFTFGEKNLLYAIIISVFVFTPSFILVPHFASCLTCLWFLFFYQQIGLTSEVFKHLHTLLCFQAASKQMYGTYVIFNFFL